jgi:preprotein translocase subunit SecA
LEDELMRRFAADRVSKVMEMVGMEEDMPLESGLVSRFIEQAQTRVEGYNFDIRKNVVDYDDVIARQREVIYSDRHAVLERADMHERILGMIHSEVTGLVNTHIPGNVVTEEEQLEGLFAVLDKWVQVPEEILPENIHAVRREELKNKLIQLIIDHYEERGRQLDELAAQNPGLGIPTIRDLERSFTLQVVDRLWMDHIDALDVMRASIHFRSIGQRDPLVEFKNEAYRMFENLKAAIQHYIVDELLKLLKGNISITVRRPEPKRKPPRSVRTNVDDIARASGQAKSDGSEDRTKGAATRKNGTGSGQRSSGQVRTATAPQPTRTVANAKIGRNDPCPCGSGKKYKKCHGA